VGRFDRIMSERWSDAFVRLSLARLAFEPEIIMLGVCVQCTFAYGRRCTQRKVKIICKGSKEDDLFDNTMDNLAPLMPTADDSASRCEHGLLRHGKCSGGVRYRLVEDNAAYFTTWNMYVTVIALLLAIFVYLPANLINGGSFLKKKKAWFINYLITPFIVMACIVSIGVLITSQSLLAFNFNQLVEVDDVPPVEVQQVNHLENLSNLVSHVAPIIFTPGAAARNALLSSATGSIGLQTAAYPGTQSSTRASEPDLLRMMQSSDLSLEQEARKRAAVAKRKLETKTMAHPDIDPHSISVEMPYVEYLMKDNFVVHIAPAIIGVVLLLLLSIGSFQAAERETVTLVTLIMCVALWAVYLIVPVKDRDGKRHVGLQKVSHVYSNPSGWIFAGQIVYTLAASFIIPFFVIGKGPCALDMLQEMDVDKGMKQVGALLSREQDLAQTSVTAASPVGQASAVPQASSGPDQLQGGLSSLVREIRTGGVKTTSARAPDPLLLLRQMP